MTEKPQNDIVGCMVSQPKSHAPALDRGMRILEELAQVHEPVTMTWIAKQLQLSVSSIQRILGELLRQGYVGKTSTNGYYLTDRIYKLAAARESEESLLSHSVVAMHSFVRRTSEGVHLSIARAGQFVVIGQVHSTDLIRISIREGSYPILDYPSGWVLWAFRAKEAWIADEVPEETSTIVEEVKANGYGFTESKVRSSIYHLAVPIIGTYGTAVGALATSFAMRRQNFTDIYQLKDYLLRELQASAGSIEAKIAPERATE